MKTVIRRKIRHALLVEPDQLRSIYDFMSERYQQVAISAKCTDGSYLDTNHIDDIIVDFANTNYRRIESLSMEGKGLYDDSWRGDDRTAALDISSNEFLGPSGEIRVESRSDEEAVYIAGELVKRLVDMKPPYSFFTRFYSSPLVFLSVACFLLFYIFFLIVLIVSFFNVSNSGFMFALPLWMVLTYGLMLLIYKLWIYLFPLVFFALGRQVKTLETVQTCRKWIFGGVIFSVILGVVVNVISAWLLS